MKKQLLLSAITVVAFLSAGTASAAGYAGKRSADFVGLWQGIDPVQGDVGLTSILPKDRGAFTILVRAKFRPCPTDEEGFSVGTFTLEDGALVTTNRTITCGDGKIIDTSVPASYRPVKRRDLLEVFVSGFPEPVITLHRISTPPFSSPRRAK